MSPDLFIFKIDIMKVFYSLVLFLFIAAGLNAQANQAISGCNDPAGGVQILFDYNKNCPLSPGSLAGMAEIGFHSGVNGWMNVVDWDKPLAVHGFNMGGDMFRVYIPDPAAYYGVATVTQFNFVFNQGPAVPGTPWGSEGKDKDNDNSGACDDFFLFMTSITTTCATSASVKENLLDIPFQVGPNPFNDKTVISFPNSNSEPYNLVIRSMTGQEMRRITGITSNSVEISKDNLAPGLYFAVFTNEAGKFASIKLAVE